MDVNQEACKWLNVTEYERWYLSTVGLPRGGERDAMTHIRAVPQRDPAWLKARAPRITASQFGSIHGTNSYSGPEEVTLGKLLPRTHGFKGNEATRWGTTLEPRAERDFQAIVESGCTLPDGPLPRDGAVHSWNTPDVADWIHDAAPVHSAIQTVTLLDVGLEVDMGSPHRGYSTDGRLRIQYTDGSVEEALVEYKCPWKGTPYSKIPLYYYDQVQGMMHALRYTHCYFVVWTPHTIKVSRIPFDPVYAGGMLAKVDRYYSSVLGPLLCWRETCPSGQMATEEDIRGRVSLMCRWFNQDGTEEMELDDNE